MVLLTPATAAAHSTLRPSVLAPRKTHCAAPRPLQQSQTRAALALAPALVEEVQKPPRLEPLICNDEPVVPPAPLPATGEAEAVLAATADVAPVTEPVPEATVPESSAAASVAPSLCSSRLTHKEHNSVTVKEDTMVKDAAGAIVKVLHRICSTFVTSLRHHDTNEAINRAVKAIAVARKYVKDADDAWEVSFLPFNRSDATGMVQPNLFAFLTFKTMIDVPLKEYDETDLNVSKSSDPNAMANAIICIVKERGQAVMKAGGNDAIYIAMSAVANARRRLKRNHDMDVMLVPSFITEDTTSTLGRVSKFLKLNILPCPVNGPLEHTVHPSTSAEEDVHLSSHRHRSGAQMPAFA